MGWFSIGAAALGLLGSKSANKANQSINDAQIAYSREAAQNAHQWEVEDLRKAGLNPILSAGGTGANASVPSMIPMQNEFEPAVNSALAARANKAQVEKLEQENKLMRDSFNTKIDTYKQELANSAKQYEKLQAEINNIRENTRNQEANNYVLKEGIDLVRPLVHDIKNAVHNAQQDTSVLDDLANGASNMWDDFSSLWKGKHYNKPTPNHKNNDWMKGRRGRS